MKIQSFESYDIRIIRIILIIQFIDQFFITITSISNIETTISIKLKRYNIYLFNCYVLSL